MERVGGQSLGLMGGSTVAFVILKLCHVIDWPWVWVLSPVWVSLGAAVVVGVVAVLVFVVIYLFVWTHKDW